MKREERRASRREDVQKAALKIVASEGLSALTIQRVAKEVDASVGGLYRYFPSKEAMIMAVAAAILRELDEAQARDLATARPLLASSGEPAVVLDLTELMLLVSVYTRLGARNFEHHALLNAVHADVSPVLPVEGAEELDRAVGPLLTRVVLQLKKLEGSGTFVPADGMMRAYVLWGTMFGINQFRTRDRFVPAAYASRKVLAEMFAALVTGFGAPRDVATRAATLWESVEARLTSIATPDPTTAV